MLIFSFQNKILYNFITQIFDLFSIYQQSRPLLRHYMRKSVQTFHCNVCV